MMSDAPARASSAVDTCHVGGVLCHNLFCQRFKAALACHLGAGVALGLERQVDVFENRRVGGGFDGGGDFVGHVALVAYRLENKFFAMEKFLKVVVELRDVENFHFVECAGGFLSVAADERNRGAFVEKFDGGFHRVFRQGKSVGNEFYEVG